MCVSPACLLPGPASFHHGLTLTSGSTNYSAQIKEQYSILHRAITSTTVNSHSPNRPPSQIKRPALPILVTQALNQTLGRQCSCVGYVWLDPWASFIPVGKSTPAHRDNLLRLKFRQGPDTNFGKYLLSKHWNPSWNLLNLKITNVLFVFLQHRFLSISKIYFGE